MLPSSGYKRKSFPLQNSLNYVAHVPYYELFYPKEGSIAKPSIKTLVTASIYNCQINVEDYSYPPHFCYLLLILYKLV